MSRPTRTCIGCGRTAEKETLLRIVRNKNGHIDPDPAARRPGRGAYLHKEAGCIQVGLAERRLARAFRGPVRVGTDDREAVLMATRVAM